ncbi:MAG: multidrug efflux SMR transporter [Desulfovibrio sp.]|nr:multidrug efflux SMR transporter [Desulfovibrio sp.]MBI4958364.1 multidrug efflux SMR transporter [Desulfovibrio sp.]
MEWAVLILAALFEIVWAVGLKSTGGFTRLWPTIIVVVSMIASMGLLGIAAKHLPIGTAYAVWTGIGTLGTVLVGMIAYGESAALPRLACIALIVAGVAGLRLFPD